MRHRAGLIVGVVMLLVAAGGIVGWRWWHNRAPYGPKALGVTATLRLVDQATADAAMSPVNAEHAADGDQIFLGRVAWRRPPDIKADSGSFRVVILDKRTRRMPGLISVTSARPDDVGAGSDGALDVAEERYPWLRGIGPREINGSFWTAGNAITVSSVAASPVTFVMVLHPMRPETPPEQAVATAPAAVSDLLVALINVGSDGQVYWAQRLLN
ncbi:hypothetical protein DMB66_06885 [Actinoplanes sp. ATCC 53533]|uniref:hypothetical protein n=1 Tax=Actinoplanes sp. ATCC 53533 TaxID=1288362 RepID=UPI000F7B50D5|nr:hypothetical protein [Actinoplanes sp. ATCC 53533]RSM72301.1 hypothetical protein DMB66_06885 [Actinoplanes sp. ATCC 53533]